MYALIACSAPLVDERVVGVDVPAEVWVGGDDARLGAAVAWSGSTWRATAPNEDRTYSGDAVVGPSVAALAWAGEAWATLGPDGAVQVAETRVADVPGAERLAAGGGAVFVATRTAVHGVSGGWVAPVEGVVALAYDPLRSMVFATACSPCVVRAWTATGAEAEVATPEAGRGGLASWEGRVYAGDPDFADGAGRVCDDAGACVEGQPGDALGASIAGGYAVGVFNARLRPPRARLVGLVGQGDLALEVGTENRPIVLDGDASTLLVGAPYAPLGGTPGGAVWQVSP